MKNYKYYLELAARWHVFALLNIYGWGKLLGGQFYRKDNLPTGLARKTLAELSGFDLAWAFMGYSKTYILFIGISQIIGAWLLIFNKTKLLGVAILTPILVNIIVFDAVFFETYGALASALIYFTLLIFILIFNKENIIKAFKTLTDFKFSFDFKKFELFKTSIVVILIMGIIFGIEQLLISYLGH